jgi:hypothetical protein
MRAGTLRGAWRGAWRGALRGPAGSRLTGTPRHTMDRVHESEEKSRKLAREREESERAAK